MCAFGGGSAPTPPPPPPPPPPEPAPTLVAPEIKQARDRNRQVAALAAGRNATIATNPLGLDNTLVSATQKQLLGQ